jgi:hypothetical protein
MANPWFRLYSEFAFDQKVQMLSEVDQRRLIMLFCLRCNGNVTLQDEEVTFQLRCSNDEWLKTKATFIAKGFINEHNEVLNWNKRQYISDSSAERVARYREKKKNDVTLSNVTVTAPEQNRTEQKQNKYVPPISSDLLDEWMSIRRKKKAGEITERVFKAIEREAEKAGWTVEKAITRCCEKSWVSFEAEWVKSEIVKPKKLELAY